MLNIIPLILIAAVIWYVYQRSPEDSPIAKLVAIVTGVALAAAETISNLF